MVFHVKSLPFSISLFATICAIGTAPLLGRHKENFENLGNRTNSKPDLITTPAMYAKGRGCSQPIERNIVDDNNGTAESRGTFALLVRGDYRPAGQNDIKMVFDVLTMDYQVPRKNIVILDPNYSSKEQVDLTFNGESEIRFKASRHSLERALLELGKRTRKGDQVVIYFTTDGIKKERSRTYVGLFKKREIVDGEIVVLPSESHLKEVITGIELNTLLKRHFPENVQIGLVIDSCYSGCLGKSCGAPNIFMVTACDENSPTDANSEWSIFTRNFLEGLRGRTWGTNENISKIDSNEDGCISFREAFKHAVGRDYGKRKPQIFAPLDRDFIINP